MAKNKGVKLIFRDLTLEASDLVAAFFAALCCLAVLAYFEAPVAAFFTFAVLYVVSAVLGFVLLSRRSSGQRKK